MKNAKIHIFLTKLHMIFNLKKLPIFTTLLTIITGYIMVLENEFCQEEKLL